MNNYGKKILIEFMPFFSDRTDMYCGLNEIYSFMKMADKFFCPPVSTKVDLKKYSQKIFDLAIIIIAFDRNEHKVCGISSFYCNPGEYEYSYLTYLAVLPEYRGRGIGNRFIEKMINYSRKQGMKGIYTDTWKKNDAIRLYMRNGFKQIDGEDKNRTYLLCSL